MFVYVGYIAMAQRHAVVQAFQFDPESDPDGEATDEEVATQQDVSEWLGTVCFLFKGPPEEF
ncbi:hypothetical protein PO909_010115 [Leuciscus waleckii]